MRSSRRLTESCDYCDDNDSEFLQTRLENDGYSQEEIDEIADYLGVDPEETLMCRTCYEDCKQNEFPENFTEARSRRFVRRVHESKVRKSNRRGFRALKEAMIVSPSMAFGSNLYMEDEELPEGSELKLLVDELKGLQDQEAAKNIAAFIIATIEKSDTNEIVQALSEINA